MGSLTTPDRAQLAEFAAEFTHAKWGAWEGDGDKETRFQSRYLRTCAIHMAAALPALLDALGEAEKALRRIMDELGVPGDGYPQPVANAYWLAREALARIGAGE